LHADRAVAAYERATIAARLARATHALEAAKEALAQSSEQVGRFSLERAKIDQQSDDLEKKLRVAREAELPPPSGPADPSRERARLLAAKSLVVEARLLCSAARLVSPRAPGLAEADAAVASLDNLERHAASATAKAPIDAAARARTACLASLTNARRTSEGGPDRTDQLLSELSQSLAAPKTRDRAQVGITPSRDERGVVVTLHGAFRGEVLSRDAEASVKELGRIAATHSGVGVQVVIHDADPPSASGMATDKKRGEAALRALVDGGVPGARATVEQAGASAPLIDPKNARGRERNARLEIVFVVGGS
jgi:flagellar motor protein MotB